MGFSLILVLHTKRSYLIFINKQTKKLVKMMKIALIASVLVASALANPAGPPPPYHPAPVHGGYKIPPRPFAYAYGVSDEYSGTNFDKKETQISDFLDARADIFRGIFWRKEDTTMSF